MPRLTRNVFVERTQDLLARQGCPDVSLSEVLAACDANKGSLYHFFPNGKDELVIAAVKRQAECALSSNRRCLQESSSTAIAIFTLVNSLGKMMSDSDYSLCLPFSAVGAISGGVSEELRRTCADALDELERLFLKSLRSEGLPARASRSLASMVVSTIEGALLQARTRQSSEPLKNAAAHLRRFIESHFDNE